MLQNASKGVGATAKALARQNGVRWQLAGSEIQTWQEHELRELCRSSDLRQSYDRWRKLSVRGSAPLLREFYGTEIEARLDESMLLLQQGSDFIYVHQGATSVKKYGRCFRGELLSALDGNMTASFLNLYNSCLRDMRPRYAQFKIEFSANHVRWERIVLPLVSDESQITKFVMTYSAPLDDKLEILTATFDRSPIGMIAAAKAIGENKSLEAAEILLMNARARTMLKVPANGFAIKTVGSLKSWIKDVASWEQIGDTSASGTRSIMTFSETATGRRVSIIIEPVDYFVVYHLIEMPS